MNLSPFDNILFLLKNAEANFVSITIILAKMREMFQPQIVSTSVNLVWLLVALIILFLQLNFNRSSLWPVFRLIISSHS